METIEIKGKGAFVGKRLDLAMVDACKGMSRRKAKLLIDEGAVFANGKKIRIASKQIEFGDTITFQYSPEPKKKKARIVLGQRDILLHKSGIIALNKPPGLPSQATKKDDRYHVVSLLKAYFESIERPIPDLELVHRLDKETSGVLLLAENKVLANTLMNQFRQKSIEKYYHAIVYGCPKNRFEVACKLSSINPKNGVVKVSKKSGKDSCTKFSKMETFRDESISLVLCQPISGRTHQIRVHLDYCGHPIVGDKVYGNKPPFVSEEFQKWISEHHLLHARTLRFSLPDSDGRTIQVKAPYPENWQLVLSYLREEP